MIGIPSMIVRLSMIRVYINCIIIVIYGLLIVSQLRIKISAHFISISNLRIQFDCFIVCIPGCFLID